MTLKLEICGYWSASRTETDCHLFSHSIQCSCLIKEACDGLFEGEGDDSFGGAAVALPLDDLGVADGHEEGQRALLERVAHHAPL